jgi:hypothetical protein
MALKRIRVFVDVESHDGLEFRPSLAGWDYHRDGVRLASDVGNESPAEAQGAMQLFARNLHAALRFSGKFDAFQAHESVDVSYKQGRPLKVDGGEQDALPFP